MITTLFSIYDIQARVYAAPFCFSTPGQAIRAFREVANDKNTMVGRHPKDYQLVSVGTFDDQTGTTTPATIVVYGTADQYIDDYAQTLPLMPSAGVDLTDKGNN